MAIDVDELRSARYSPLGELLAGDPFHPATSTPDGDVTDLFGWFLDRGLPTPPVPASLAPGLRQHTPSVWSSVEIDPWRLVDNDRALDALQSTGETDHLVVGHVCRNSERSRVTYQLAHRGLAIVASCFWRNDERTRDAEVIDQTFFAIDALLANLDPGLEQRWSERPGLMVEVHGRSVRWWRPEHERGPFQHGPDAEACWKSLADAVCVERPSWRLRVLDQLPRA